MSSEITLALGTALAGIALCCFVESGFAQDAVVASIAESDTDDADESDGRDDKSNRPRSRPSDNLVSANSRKRGRYRNVVRHLSSSVSRITASGRDENQCRQENVIREASRVPHLCWQ